MPKNKSSIIREVFEGCSKKHEGTIGSEEFNEKVGRCIDESINSEEEPPMGKFKLTEKGEKMKDYTRFDFE